MIKTSPNPNTLSSNNPTKYRRRKDGRRAIFGWNSIIIITSCFYEMKNLEAQGHKREN